VDVGFQILSLSGGGYLGLYTVAVLAELERRNQGPIAKRFDLLAGTSIGGITALALAAEISAAKVQEAFETNGMAIFGTGGPPRSRVAVFVDLSRKAFSSRYRADALRSTIADIVGEDLRIGELRHPVLIPAVNLSKGSPQVFKTPHHQTFQFDLNLRVVDVAMATSAAPTFFPIAQIGEAMYADGGLYANSPDLMALHEATYFLEQKETDIRLLSVGTTTAQFAFAHAMNKRFGIAQWFKGTRLLNVIIASQQRSVDFMMKHRLGANYLRLDEIQSKEQEQILALDVATEEARLTILALAAGTAQREINNPLLQEILRHTAQDPRFFHAVQRA
jgi:patatin-like phospholipase/acyl hydrolase